MEVEKVQNCKRKKGQKTEKTPKRPRTSSKSKRKPGFDENIYKETEYFFKDGLRCVKPYPFTFTTYCKGRWLRRKLIDVLAKEFQSETAEYYSKAIRNGNIKVNGDVTTEDLILTDNDIITHKVHRHEPPVTAEPISIIAESEDIVVVNKPSSIPIHPCGRYRHNTLVFILGREYGLINLYTIHRIDRLTSGIVMFAKSLQKAQELEKQLRERELLKEYVCKVRGEFASGAVECSQPIAVVSHKVGVCRVHADGKLCKTIFTREYYDGTNSIVKCKPFTGRMHQIRVHLQWLGHPIVDDPIYNHEAWGPGRGNGGVKDEQAWKVIESIATSLRNNDAGVDLIANNGKCKTEMEKNSQSNDGTKNCEDTNLDQQVNKRVITEKGDVLCASTCAETLDVIQKSGLCAELKQEKPDGIDLRFMEIQAKQEIRETETKQAMASASACPGAKSNVVKQTEQEVSCNELDFPTMVSENVSGISTSPKIRKEETESTHNVSEEETFPDCTECRIQRRDPKPEELKMCLHAAVYKGPDWEFCCPWPSWALKQINSEKQANNTLR